MANQNECDHVVGIYAAEKRWADQIRMSVCRDYKNNYNNHIPMDVVFDYCPLCGERIDWDRIKEEVNAKS